MCPTHTILSQLLRQTHSNPEETDLGQALLPSYQGQRIRLLGGWMEANHNIYPGGGHVLGWSTRGGWNELVFRLHLLLRSCLFFHCPVPGGVYIEGALCTVCVSPCSRPLPTPIRTLEMGAGGGAPRGRDGRLQCYWGQARAGWSVLQDGWGHGGLGLGMT